ncbi:DmsC/YnfH family molybdoenzyme membrane anchor subunit [Vibrio agarivorans]|uniref:Dimethyl sulfoxide reductase anchor subunit n=1 Tax=Vibrio agarivorans TaxID=153622 RepID=A0ABT7Y4Z2_9VIBR|nr:DmsC/YnfH family molybdoenzyme membrane anchor subunit [Vibrio agarivorans]MDN2483115.1 dimethyl sulfoxide reductase anchor subunit [Vibrio agarivorans]
MGWHEWPLIFFTVFAQTAVGAFIVVAILNLVVDLKGETKAKLNRNLFFVWAFMALGFMASTAHLGSPMRAINALNQVGESWLSREILFGSAFFGLGGLYWLAELLNKGSAGLRKAMMVGTMVIGVVFMYAMTNVYLINTVPTWDTPFTSVNFALTLVLCGVILAQVLAAAAGFECPKFNNWAMAGGVLAVIAIVIATMAMVGDLNTIRSAIVSANELVPNMASIQNVRFAMIFVGVAIWLISIRKNAMPMGVAGLALVMVAELIGRSVFFGLHMTAGM